MHPEAPHAAAAPAAWLPPGKRGAVVLHIDDVHPATSRDAYEAGGDLGAGALGHVEWLLERHPYLHVTLFTTPDWRETAAAPTRTLLARVPGVRDRVYLAPILPRGTMRLDRHPRFVQYVAALPRTEVALHGLHHVHTGLDIPAEFQEQSRERCGEMLREGMEIFAAAGLPAPQGMTPPRFSTPPALLGAMADRGMAYVASSRDILTDAAPGARSAMSGLRGTPLLEPSLLPGGLVHLPTNFQATSLPDRAHAILQAGGLLSIKGHIVKQAFGHIALDGMDALYRNYLHLLFDALHQRYGESIWWTTMAGVARQVRAAALQPSAPDP